ncbi:MAG: substrate-binding domain-containing protein [Terriglobales bacterium]
MHAPQVALLLETSTEYGRGLLRGILRYSRLHGPWTLVMAPGHLDQMSSLERALGRGWKGQGMIGRVRPDDLEGVARTTKVPLVASSLSEALPAVAGERYGEIRTDSAQIAAMGLSHLREAGFRRLAYVGFRDCQWALAREQAFVRLAREAGLECAVHRTPLANWMRRPQWLQSWQREQPLLVRWLVQLTQVTPRQPLGLLACNDVCGREVLAACAAAGLRVPDDVAVIGVDNDEMICELASPPLSSLAMGVEAAGYAAASLLDRMMRGQPAAERTVWVRPNRVVVRTSSDVIAQEDELVAAALRLIRERAREPIGVEDVTRGLQVSRRTLERRFQATVGRTVLEEITRCHIQRAKQLLQETDLPAYRIAAAAGFGSQKAFQRAFEREAGMTPGQYRTQG